MINFSVLLTVYHKDNPEFLRLSLDSILNQTLQPSEVIIVADGPLTEALYQVIDVFKTDTDILVKEVFLSKNIGTGLAINEGLKQCSFDLVAKMDSDDINYPFRFEKQIKIFETYPELSIVGSSIAEFENNDPSKISSYRSLPQNHLEIVKYAKSRCPMNQPTVMYRKSDILACDGYRKFTFGEDYDLWIRAILKGYKFYNIQEPLLYFRTNVDTIKKRGGWWYLKIDLSHHYDFYKMGFISISQLLYNSSTRIVVRLIPLKLRLLFYKKVLRSKEN